MKGENMGKDAVTDFLTISYSTPDIAGHAFGPYSLEMEDMYFRLDREIARLLTELDKNVGKGQYVIYLTADHAVVPVPQFLKEKNLPGGYLYTETKFANLKSSFQAKFSNSGIIEITNNNVYLKPGSEFLPNYSEMLAFLKMEIEKWPEVKAVYDRNELKDASGTNWEQMVCAGFDRERSGDLIFILQPGYLNKSNESSAHKGTSHGSAFNYDTHVPVLFYGKGIPKQEVFTAYEITDIAATLVHVLDVQRPNAMIGKPMVELFSKSKK
jgi:predicted AlkP superfamily pyrophosphatase or phosphodiesterase